MALYACYAPFFAELGDDALVLTPNLRLSRFVQEQWDNHQQMQGNTAWRAMPCLAWQAWVRALQREALLGDTLANEQQLRVLWQQTLAAEAADYAHNEALLNYAKTAWERLRMWRLGPSSISDGEPETELLCRLMGAFESRCKALSLLDFPACLEQVIESLVKGCLQPPTDIWLLGFDDVPPLLEHLFDALRQHGVQVKHRHLRLDADVAVAALHNAEAEIDTALQWAAAKLEGAEGAPLRIGIVVPNLAAMRPMVERMLVRQFEPGYIYPAAPRHAPGYNISAGQPLAQTPLVATALAALNLNQGRVALKQLVELIHSPFLWPGVSVAARVKLSDALRSRYLALTLRELCAAVAAELGEPQIELLLSKLQAFQALAQANRRQRQSHRLWAQVFQAQLAALGWPGDRPLDTLEYQQYQAWCEACITYATLDRVADPSSLGDARARLQRSCYTPFLAQTLASPIQVLGLLEAAGLHFDALWVMGLAEPVWPEPCEPNPLLPAWLQKQQGMPRASVQREYELARRITERFQHAAAEVVFSWPQWQGDEPQRPSTLLANIPGREITAARAAPYPTPAAPLERLNNTRGAAVLPEARAVGGGAGLLKDQAACPFRAYARYRLHAVNAEQKEAGVSPRVRGQLLHDALARIWANLRGRAALLAATDEALRALIGEQLARSWASQVRGTLGERTRSLELARAERMLRAWLECEKARADFSVVHMEQDLSGQVGPLTLQLRLDRLDGLASGGFAVIDYKTGKTDIKSWFGERPDEPQVPLYSVLQADTRAAIFAELSTDAVAARGVAEQAEWWPGLTPPQELQQVAGLDSWQALLELWRSTLSQLAKEFAEGHAAVNPKAGSATCRYCDLQSLCRIQHQADQASENADAAG